MRIAMGIEYNGHSFFGWQRQDNLPTIQGHLEEALSKVANEPIITICAGRTDAGVHASGQVIHFDTTAEREIHAWVMGTNTYLPHQIAIQWAKVVDETFHARFSAIARRYHYIIHNHKYRPGVLFKQVTWYPHSLNINAMKDSIDCLIGEHDFSSFRSSQCESKTPMRNVQEITIQSSEDTIIIEIQANAFLHHMVRNIVGALLRIGSGYEDPSWMKALLDKKDRREGGITAPPSGLYLLKVYYS